MARKPLTTTIEESVQLDFKEACQKANIKMNIVLEALMKGFVDGKFTATTEVVITVNEQQK